MVFALLSPAKTLAFDTAREDVAAHVEMIPHFQKDAVHLVKELQAYDAKKLAKLMALSPKLAELNVERFAHFKSKPGKQAETAPAILAYRGDTYQGFDVDTLTAKQIQYAHTHLGILTGLYGVLQPLEAIQPYRLEMGTALKSGVHKDLYHYWGTRITQRVNELAHAVKAKAIIGLASQEYLKSVQIDGLEVPFINCDFKEKKNGKYQTIGIMAKRARGMMARYIVTEKTSKPDDLKAFDLGDYRFNATLSDEHNFVFVR